MDAATVRAWAVASARALGEARAPIDSLNVFPVPDGDTGTNLALTVAEGAEHVREHASGPDSGDDAVEVATAFARGALRGARGNSGVIVSQYLHGFAVGLAAADGAPGQVVAAALDEAQRAARAAVAKPVEGTILTAATTAAHSATDVARAGGDAAAVTAAAVTGARAAVVRSPQALDVLRVAGVVDAGASGLVVLLEALATVVRGSSAMTSEIARVVADVVPRRRPAPGDRAVPGDGVVPSGTAASGPRAADGAATAATAGATTREPADRGADGLDRFRPPEPVPGEDDGEFEVMFVVEPHLPGPPTRDLAPELSARMQALGSSVAVVGGPDGWHVHVHTDHPAEAVAAGRDVGGVQSQVVVRRLASADDGQPDVGVVVGTSAPGLVADLARSGALVMVLTGSPVGARDVLRSVVDTRARHVVVVPGSPGARAAARSAAEVADVRVDVLDATDDARVVVALTAAAGAGPDVAGAMRGAVEAARTAVVQDAGAGGLATLVAEVDRLLADGGELVTVVAGRDLSAGTSVDRVRDDLTDALAASHPEVEVVVLSGQQDRPAAVVAVE